MSGIANQVVDSVIQGSTIAMTYKILFTKQRSFGQIFSMDTLNEGAKLSAATFIYQVAARPVVRTAQSAVMNVVGKNV